MKLCILLASIPLFLSCNAPKAPQAFSLGKEVGQLPNIQGKKGNGNYLYVTAGNNLYSIGNQYGDFPPAGFHVPGEMSGIWQHPIKLLDGFTLSIQDGAKSIVLDKCDSFITYPLATQFKYDGADDLEIVRTDFVPDSLPVLAVEYQVRNKTNQPKEILLSLTADTDLSPVWLGERSGMTDTRDQYTGLIHNTVFAKDSLKNWFVGVTSDQDSLSIDDLGNSPVQGQGISVKLNTPRLNLAANEVRNIRFFISGSMKNETEIQENLRVAKENLKDLYEQKRLRYEEIDRTAAITIPDTLLMTAYQWGKYNSDWLVRDVPGLGNAMSAGLPDYPWFFSNDQSITFKALVGTRDPGLFYNSMKMIKEVSDKFNNNTGRIVHEFSTNGAVYDKGRMEESQEFIIATWEIFKWTGNIDFLRTYYEHGIKVWEFLQEHDTNHNLYVEGPGGVEIKGLNDEMLDVAVHTQTFLDVMSQAAAVLNEPDLSKDFASKAEQLKEKINEDWWSPSEKRFADFISDQQKAVQLIDMALQERVIPNRNEWARKELTALKERILKGEHKEKGFTVFYNASCLLPIKEGIADRDKALQMLDEVSFFTNKFGIYVAGIARPDDITLEECSVADRLNGDFNYNEAIMQGATSSLAIAECQYRGFESARKYIRQILNNFSFATPGTTYEVSPDYGMFVQAWNVSGYNIPLIHYVFGVDPMAYKKEINIKTDIPEDWEYAKLDNLLVGNNQLSIDYQKSGQQKSFVISCTENGWNLHFTIPVNCKSIKINGKEIPANSGSIDLTGIKNTIELI